MIRLLLALVACLALPPSPQPTPPPDRALTVAPSHPAAPSVPAAHLYTASPSALSLAPPTWTASPSSPPSLVATSARWLLTHRLLC